MAQFMHQPMFKVSFQKTKQSTWVHVFGNRLIYYKLLIL